MSLQSERQSNHHEIVGWKLRSYRISVKRAEARWEGIKTKIKFLSEAPQKPSDSTRISFHSRFIVMRQRVRSFFIRWNFWLTLGPQHTKKKIPNERRMSWMRIFVRSLYEPRSLLVMSACPGRMFSFFIETTFLAPLNNQCRNLLWFSSRKLCLRVSFASNDSRLS